MHVVVGIVMILVGGLCTVSIMTQIAKYGGIEQEARPSRVLDKATSYWVLAIFVGMLLGGTYIVMPGASGLCQQAIPVL